MRFPVKLNLLSTGCFFFLLAALASCVGSRSEKGSEVPNYMEVYHPVIDKAELQIVEQNFSDALQLYQQAFAAVPDPFAADYYNAAVCATLLENNKEAFKLLNKLALKGVSLDYIEKQEAFKPLQETKEWAKFEKSYAKNRAKFKRRADLDLRADLDELYAKDQFFRQAKGGLRVHLDTIRKIEESNVQFLLATIEEHGYPGETLIGVADTLEQLPRFSIVIQRQVKARNGYNFEPILKEAIQKGRIRPQVAAYLLEQQGQGAYKSRAIITIDCNSPKNCENAGVEGKFFRDRLTNSQLDELNKSRAALGLSSFPDYRRKVIFSAKDNRFKLSNYWSITNYVVPSKEAVNVITEGRVAADIAD